MKIFHGTENANILRPTVLTLGVFDGLHLGHQRIMNTVVERARAVDAHPTAITFDPHPRAVLHPETAPPLLQTLDQRLANFQVLGIEQAIVIPFNKDFAAQPAEDFLSSIIRDRLHAREVYLGKGFAFGKDRGGNIDLLREMSASLGFVADEVDEVQLRGHRISSSRVRKLLAEGRVNLARRMLGRPYGVEGVIIRGNRRGHTIGFPTANLRPHNRVIPRYGVYATATLIEGAWRKSITNIGVRPTFENDAEPSIESYIFDFDGELYGDVLRVRFLHRIRDEKKFAGIAQLKAQIERDTAREELFPSQGRKEYARFALRCDMEVHVSQYTESRIREIAEDAGKDIAEVAGTLLEERVEQVHLPKTKGTLTLADMAGMFSGGPGDTAERASEILRAEMGLPRADRN